MYAQIVYFFVKMLFESLLIYCINITFFKCRTIYIISVLYWLIISKRFRNLYSTSFCAHKFLLLCVSSSLEEVVLFHVCLCL